MATRINAYLSRNGAIFKTEEEAEKADIRDAAEVIAGDSAAQRTHLINVGLGHSCCARTREAVCYLADVIRKRPLPAPPDDQAVSR